MTLDAARRLMAEALGKRLEDITADARLGELEGWDSLGHMRIVLAVEAALGRQLFADEIVAIATLDDVARLIASQP